MARIMCNVFYDPYKHEGCIKLSQLGVFHFLVCIRTTNIVVADLVCTQPPIIVNIICESNIIKK